MREERVALEHCVDGALVKINQKIAISVALISFLLSAGAVESSPLTALIMLIVMGMAIKIGNLNKKRTSIGDIQREYKL